MVKCVPIYTADLDGTVTNPDTPHYLGIDINVSREWGVPIEDLSVFGIDGTVTADTETSISAPPESGISSP